MKEKKIGHGFTAVDAQDDPRFWVAALDRLQQEPFFRAYKARLVELLGPRRFGVYLDLGAGTGDDARAIAEDTLAIVVAVDSSRTMMAEARSRGLCTAVVGDGISLPFLQNSFDGSWADRTFQHLSDPDCVLDEIIRVTKPGGRIVIVDPDYDTQVMEFPDQELARRVFRFRAEVGLRNGTIAHRMAGIFGGRGLADVNVEGMTLIIRDPTALHNVLGLRSWAESAQSIGWFTEAEVARWKALYDEVVAAGRFMWSVTFYLTAGVKPA